MREDQWATYVAVDGKAVPAPGASWDLVSGGQGTAADTKYRPGGMAQEVSLGGPQSLDDVTVTKLLVLESDWDLMRALMARRGKAQMTVIRQPLDTDGNRYGNPLTYTGTLLNVVPPDANSTGANAAQWALVCSPQTVA